MRCQIAVFKYERHPSTAKNVAKYFAMNFSVVPETVASIIMAYYCLKSAAATKIKKKLFLQRLKRCTPPHRHSRGLLQWRENLWRGNIKINNDMFLFSISMQFCTLTWGSSLYTLVVVFFVKKCWKYLWRPKEKK